MGMAGVLAADQDRGLRFVHEDFLGKRYTYMGYSYRYITEWSNHSNQLEMYDHRKDCAAL
eukprot:COSAG02_NODE_5907_length_3944_cov_7.939922_2_plen_60_part_00